MTNETNRASLLAQLSPLCARLYSSRTPASEREELSMQVAILRARLAGTNDPLAAMTAASANDEEC